MTNAERTSISNQMSIDARAIASPPSAHATPDYDDVTARWALFRMLVGDELFTRAWPHAPLVDP